MSVTVSQRALDWMQSWAAIGGSLGSDDQGRLVLILEDGDSADARHLSGVIAATPGLADEIAEAFILMLQADRPGGTTLQ
jgi:hypothetical protein